METQLSKALTALDKPYETAVAKNGVPTNGRSSSVAINPESGRETATMKLLTGGNGNLNVWVSWALVTDAGTRQVVVGSLLGIAGNGAFFGQGANASDAAGTTATDSAGAAVVNVGPIQGFSHLSVAKNMVVDEFVLDGAEAAINAVVARYRVLHFDGTLVQDQLIPFAQGEARSDQNVTTWRVKGPFLLSELTFLQFSSTAAQNYTLRLKVPFWVGGQDFTSVGSRG